MLASLSRGLPMVLLPMISDQQANDERAATSVAASVANRPKDVGAAVQEARLIPDTVLRQRRWPVRRPM